MKVLYSALYRDDGHPFNTLAQQVDVAQEPDDLKEADSALVIWGGSDINPDYYKHPMHSTTYPGGARDRYEWGLLQRAIEKDMPIIGVCRGAQMLCAAAGGFLLQDVNNHHGHHYVTTVDGDTFDVNSIHHQMMCWDGSVTAELLAWRPPTPLSPSGNPHAGMPYGYMDDKIWEPPAEWREPEFVYFPKINGYAIQWHPEMMRTASDATQYILNVIKKKESEREHQSTNYLSCTC